MMRTLYNGNDERLKECEKTAAKKKYLLEGDLRTISDEVVQNSNGHWDI